jgi:sigma-54-dependent transcriptional regulator
MFSQLPQPLAYAEALLEEFGSLARAVDEASLFSGLVSGLARLSGCELAQLYSVDATEDRLFMAAECLDGSLQPREAPSLSVDGSGEQLLRFALRQDRVVCFSDLANSLHETRFLPPRDTAWQSLLCIPITGRPGTGHGLLVCASSRTLEPIHSPGWAASCWGSCSCFNGRGYLPMVHRRGASACQASVPTG